ncbi:MAG: hypothetical protein ACLPKB_03000 [Xanthobacteraceae bacterium]
MGRAHTFFGKCIREAAQGTVKLANVWYWPLAIPLVALGEYFCRDSLPPGPLADLWAGLDERRALIAFAALTVAVSWLLFFLLRLIGAPARLYAAAQAKIRALAAEVEERKAAQESDIALVFAADDLAPERRVLPHDDAASKSGAPDVGSDNQAPRYSVAVNNVGDNILRDCQVNVQVYGDAWLAPGRRLIPVPVPVGEKFSLRPGESKSVALMHAPPEAPSAALVLERYQESTGVGRQGRPELAPGSYTIKVVALSADTRPAQLHLRLTHQHSYWTLRRAFNIAR